MGNSQSDAPGARLPEAERKAAGLFQLGKKASRP